MKVFVYGTLKRGRCRAPALSGQQFLGEAQTQPVYRLYDCGSYPGLIAADKDGLSIEGELWDVDAACLAELDRIEEVADELYERAHVALQPPFADIDAVTYFFRKSVSGLRDCGRRW